MELSTGTNMGGGVMLDGEYYSLLYVDLHSPAEHTVRGPTRGCGSALRADSDLRLATSACIDEPLNLSPDQLHPAEILHTSQPVYTVAWRQTSFTA